MALPEPILLTALAVTGYLLFYIFSIPTPALLGPFVAVMLAGVLGVEAEPLGHHPVILLQALLGANIGVKVTRKIFQQMKILRTPSLIMIGWTLLVSFGLGMILVIFFQMDITTALLSSTPSGVSEMGILAVAMGANAGIVTIFQLARLLITLTVFPVIVEKITLEEKVKEEKRSIWKACSHRIGIIKKEISKLEDTVWPGTEIFPYLTTLVIGMLGAFLGTWLGIPAGALMGAFFLVGTSVIAGIPLKAPPPFLRIIMQLGIATMLALNVINSPMESIQKVLVPMIGFTSIMYLGVYALYRLLRRVTQWDPVSCLLTAAPVGITPMSILAYEYAERPLEVVLLHMTRILVGKIIVIPAIIIFLM